MTPIERWLAARNPIEIRDAFDALPSTRQTMGGINRKLTVHGAAQLAGAMLGQRADWMVEKELGPATYRDGGISDVGSFLDHAWRISGRCQTDLRIHERRDGLRGVQLISVSAGSVPGEGPPEGGGMTFVRVFDRDRAASVPIDGHAQEVALVGDIDLTPLDLYDASGHFQLATGKLDVATIRAVVAQLLAEVDAHYDTSTEWPQGADIVVPTWYEMRSQQTFVHGDRAVSTGKDRANRVDAYVHGLPWGHRLGLQLTSDTTGYFFMRFPGAELDRIEARFAALKG